MLADFKVIEIVNDNNTYPLLLGIDWAIDMNGVINLRKHKMSFEKNSLRVVVPLDPMEGSRYAEPMCDYDSNNDVDCIYKITMCEWVNLTTDGRISWDCKSSCTSYSNKEIKSWQNQLHEVTMLNCNMMMRSLWCVIVKRRDMPTYDGLGKVEEFLNKF